MLSPDEEVEEEAGTKHYGWVQERRLQGKQTFPLQLRHQLGGGRNPSAIFFLLQHISPFSHIKNATDNNMLAAVSSAEMLRDKEALARLTRKAAFLHCTPLSVL